MVQFFKQYDSQMIIKHSMRNCSSKANCLIEIGAFRFLLNKPINNKYKVFSIRTIFLILVILMSVQGVSAKSYPFDMNHPYEVIQVRVSQEGTKFLKVWGVAGSADKAIERALQDAVAACIFMGVEGTESAGKIPALCADVSAYQEHKEYFDKFFKKGDFMNYVQNVNKGYPTGENNVSTSEGRKVGIYVVVMYDSLRKKLEQDGIIHSLDSYF